MADLKDEILSEIDDKFSEFKPDILSKLKQQLKKLKLKKHSEVNWKKGRARVNSFSASRTC